MSGEPPSAVSRQHYVKPFHTIHEHSMDRLRSAKQAAIVQGPGPVAIECRVVPKDCPVRSHASVDGLYLIENKWLIKITKASRLPTIQ